MRTSSPSLAGRVPRSRLRLPISKAIRHCAPSVRQHLPLLARLSRILNNPGVRLRLSTVTSAPEFIQMMTAAEELIS